MNRKIPSDHNTNDDIIQYANMSNQGLTTRYVNLKKLFVASLCFFENMVITFFL